MIVYDFRYCVPPYPEYVDGIAIKLTEGTAWVNPLAARQALGGDVKLHWHYWLPNVDPKRQAAHYVNVASYFQGEQVLDCESTYAAVRGATPGQIKTCIDEIEFLSGTSCWLYTRRSWWAYRVGVTTWGGGHKLWVAHYGAIGKPAIPAEWSTYDAWQFQGDTYWPGFVYADGKPGRVDVNHFLTTP